MANQHFIKRLLIAFLFLLMFGSMSAQQHNLFLGIHGGPSFPLGKYHETSLDGGSFAITGYHITADGIWFFHSGFGLGISGSLQQHPVDVASLGYEELLADPFMQDVYIRSEAYLMITGMAGPWYRGDINEKLHYSARIMGGLLYGRTPWQLYKQEFFMVGLQYGEITSAKDWKWAGKAGFGLRYDLTPCFGILLDSEINYGALSFAFSSSSGTRIDDRKIFFLNTGLGLEFNIR